MIILNKNSMLKDGIYYNQNLDDYVIGIKNNKPIYCFNACSNKEVDISIIEFDQDYIIDLLESEEEQPICSFTTKLKKFMRVCRLYAYIYLINNTYYMKNYNILIHQTFDDDFDIVDYKNLDYQGYYKIYQDNKKNYYIDTSKDYNHDENEIPDKIFIPFTREIFEEYKEYFEFDTYEDCINMLKRY